MKKFYRKGITSRNTLEAMIKKSKIYYSFLRIYNSYTYKLNFDIIITY